jgi:ABC-type tungstate transport system permease subunit
MRPGSVIVAVMASCLSAAIATEPTRAADISLMTTGAVEYILCDLIPPFERTSGHKVAMTVLGTGPARQFVAFITEPSAAGAVQKNGMVPAPR